jgi:hypothetical protein
MGVAHNHTSDMSQGISLPSLGIGSGTSLPLGSHTPTSREGAREVWNAVAAEGS